GRLTRTHDVVAAVDVAGAVVRGAGHCADAGAVIGAPDRAVVGRGAGDRSAAGVVCAAVDGASALVRVAVQRSIAGPDLVADQVARAVDGIAVEVTVAAVAAAG